MKMLCKNCGNKVIVEDYENLDGWLTLYLSCGHEKKSPIKRGISYES